MLEAPAARQLDSLLGRICEELQLPESLHRLAEERYRAVAEWLAARESPLAGWHPEMYPQGSFRIGTTTRPLSGDEYDLDFVCEFHLDTRGVEPASVLNAVEAR